MSKTTNQINTDNLNSVEKTNVQTDSEKLKAVPNKKICFYFQIHQPFRINKVRSEILNSTILPNFFVGPNPANKGADASNETIFNKVAKSCYIPATKKWISLFEKFDKLKMTLSFSGTFLEQCLSYGDLGSEVIETFQDFYSTSRVEILSETYYHSLAFLYDTEEYVAQINKHRDIIGLLFNTTPTSFRNTEIIYNDRIGEIVRNLGFESMLISQVKDNLENHHTNLALANKITLSDHEMREINKTAKTPAKDKLGLLLGNKEYLDKLFFMNDLEELVNQIEISESEIINIFTDYEIFGEHNDDNFYIKLENFIDLLIKKGFEFVTPKDISFEKDIATYKCEEYSTWANSYQDLRSWSGNDYQNSAHQSMKKLIEKIKNISDKDSEEYKHVLDSWRKLSTSDHFYYMPELDGADGMMHAMFNPYADALDAYEHFMFFIKYLDKVVDQIKMIDNTPV